MSWVVSWEQQSVTDLLKGYRGMFVQRFMFYEDQKGIRRPVIATKVSKELHTAMRPASSTTWLLGW
jgi:hypothetical protein